jgi:hypothetical protein
VSPAFAEGDAEEGDGDGDETEEATEGEGGEEAPTEGETEEAPVEGETEAVTASARREVRVNLGALGSRNRAAAASAVSVGATEGFASVVTASGDLRLNGEPDGWLDVARGIDR